MTNDVPEWATPSFRGGRHAPLLSPLSQLTGILEDGLTVSTCHRPLLLLPQWVMWVKWLVGQVECSGGPMVRWCYGVVSVVLAPVKWLLMKVSIRLNATCCRESCCGGRNSNQRAISTRPN